MRASILSHRLLGPNGWQTVAQIVAEMQRDGTRQILIDRWLQGMGRHIALHHPEHV
jgi:hypothetical protein